VRFPAKSAGHCRCARHRHLKRQARDGAIAAADAHEKRGDAIAVRRGSPAYAATEDQVDVHGGV
jgi:hypothetical protein